MQVSLEHITKIYGRLKANDDIHLKLEPGTIHAILGENGAGKSTLMKILAGYSRPTGGTLRIDGEPVRLRSPGDGLARGIGMLFQDPMDFPSMTVLDNFIVGQKDGGRRQMASRLAETCRGFGFDLSPDATVARLTVGERQQLELVRLFALGVKVLILDEPTTGITSAQKEKLFEALRVLAGRGCTVVLVSHKLADVEALCHRVTVLRSGRIAGEAEAPFDADLLLDQMFGTRPRPPERPQPQVGLPILEVREVTAPGGRLGLIAASLVVRRHEMVGLAGLEGSGQNVLMRVCAGIQRPLAGDVHIDGRRMPLGDGREFRRAGARFMPAARMEEGLFADLTVAEHVALLHGGGLWLDRRAVRRQAEAGIDAFQVRGTPDSRVWSLSGGNQQRLLLSFLPREPRLLLLEHPTRGLDLASAHWVWGYLRGLCHQGAAVVFTSADLDEIFMVADRVAVFFNGSIVLDAPVAGTDPAQVAHAMAGEVR